MPLAVDEFVTAEGNIPFLFLTVALSLADFQAVEEVEEGRQLPVPYQASVGEVEAAAAEACC